MQRVLGQEERRIAEKLKFIVTETIEECDEQMRNRLQSILMSRGIKTGEVIDDTKDHYTLLYEVLMFMEEATSPAPFSDRLINHTYRGVVKKLLQFSELFTSIPEDSIDSIVANVKKDPSKCTTSYIDQKGERNEFSVCDRDISDDEETQTLRVLLKSKSSSVTRTIMDLPCAQYYIERYGITIAQGIEAIHRWNDQRKPDFKLYPDLEQNMLQKCIDLFKRERML